MKNLFLLFIFIFAAGEVFAQTSEALTDEAAAFRPGRIELVISASTTTSLESYFGHASLLIVPEDGDLDEAYVFSFLAVTKESSQLKYYADGLTGQFPFQLAVYPANKFLFDKAFQEQRSVTRVILPATDTQKQNLWRHLLKLRQNPKLMGDYYFVRYNCATAALAALKESGIQIHQKQIVFRSPVKGVRPLNMPEMMREALLTPYPTLYVPSVHDMVKPLEEKYGHMFTTTFGSKQNEKNSAYEPWSAEILRVLPQLKTEELLLISQRLAPADRVRAEAIENVLRIRPRGPTKLVRFTEVSQVFYTVCEDLGCARKVVGELARNMGRPALAKLLRANTVTAGLALTSFKPEIDFSTSPQARHWQLLNQAMKEFLAQR